MDATRNETLKDRDTRRERSDLFLLAQEMEARHQQVLRLMETSRLKLKASPPPSSAAS